MEITAFLIAPLQTLHDIRADYTGPPEYHPPLPLNQRPTIASLLTAYSPLSHFRSSPDPELIPSRDLKHGEDIDVAKDQQTTD